MSSSISENSIVTIFQFSPVGEVNAQSYITVTIQITKTSNCSFFLHIMLMKHVLLSLSYYLRLLQLALAADKCM